MVIRATTHTPPSDLYEVKTQENSQDTVILTQPLEEEDLHESPASEEDRPTKIAKKTVSFDETMLEYRTPLRRFPPVSPSDTIIGTMDTPYHSRTIFVPDTDIVLVHRMKHLSDKHAVTLDRKNIFLQQGQRGCNPAAISMLSADMGGNVLTQEMRRTNITSDYLEELYIKRAGFTPVVHALSGYPFEKAQQLGKLLAEGGSGILHIQHPETGGHVVVLDSIKGGLITFRDPYHGWMITMKTSTFQGWISSRFVQFQLPKSLQRANTY